jgi:hypothetical protein
MASQVKLDASPGLPWELVRDHVQLAVEVTWRERCVELTHDTVHAKFVRSSPLWGRKAGGVGRLGTDSSTERLSVH